MYNKTNIIIETATQCLSLTKMFNFIGFLLQSSISGRKNVPHLKNLTWQSGQKWIGNPWIYIFKSLVQVRGNSVFSLNNKWCLTSKLWYKYANLENMKEQKSLKTRIALITFREENFLELIQIDRIRYGEHLRLCTFELWRFF